MRKRRTARVLLFDDTGAVLLIRCVSPRTEGDFVFWLTPGGEIEDGESEAEAAERELHEELGLRLKVTGPIRVHENVLHHNGEVRDNVDFYFRAQCARDAPKLAGLTQDEIALMREIRWWTSEEIATSPEIIFPMDLAAWLLSLGDTASGDSPD